MKKNTFFVVSCLLIVFSLVSICTLAHSFEWHTANQSTIVWNAVTTLENNATIPESNIIEYKLWLANALTDPDKENPLEVGVTSETLYVVTLHAEGKFFVGLQTIRKSQGGDLIGESGIGWTDDPKITAPGPTFGLQYFILPAMVSGVGLL